MLPPSDEFLTFAHQLANEAREITLKFFRKPINITQKQDGSPVTLADKNCEKHLRTRIKNHYPTHQIIGEEYGNTGESDYQWIIDPIDGTKSFLSGFPIYCTLIALLYQNRPLISIIDMPALNERFSASNTQKTQHNHNPIHTRKTKHLKNAICYSTDPDMFNPKQKKISQNLKKHIALQRFTGDGYNYAMLAAGWIDLVLEADMKPYDYLPLILIVEQAGGIISDWQGQTLTPKSNGEILASATPELHQQALNIIQKNQ